MSANIVTLWFQVYNDGMRNLNMKFIMVEICLPVSTCLGLALAVPYVIAYSIVPALGKYFPIVQNL